MNRPISNFDIAIISVLVFLLVLLDLLDAIRSNESKILHTVDRIICLFIILLVKSNLLTEYVNTSSFAWQTKPRLGLISLS